MTMMIKLSIILVQILYFLLYPFTTKFISFYLTENMSPFSPKNQSVVSVESKIHCLLGEGNETHK